MSIFGIREFAIEFFFFSKDPLKWRSSLCSVVCRGQEILKISCDGGLFLFLPDVALEGGVILYHTCGMTDKLIIISNRKLEVIKPSINLYFTFTLLTDLLLQHRLHTEMLQQLLVPHELEIEKTDGDRLPDKKVFFLYADHRRTGRWLDNCDQRLFKQ